MLRRRTGQFSKTQLPTHASVACVMGDMDLLQPVAMAGIACAVVARPGVPSLYSRFTRAHLCWDDFSEQSGALLDALLRFAAAQRQRPVLFYEEDAQLIFISRHRERLARAFRFVVADAALVDDLVDKARFQALAERLGLPVPPARRFHPAAARPADLGIGFPVVIKPLTRVERWNEAFGLRKALEADSLDALEAIWPQLLGVNVDCLAQQLVAGAEAQIESYHCYVDAGGSIAAEFTGRKIRTFPLCYGHTTALEITDAADVRQQGRDIVEGIGLIGVAKLDFKRDSAGALHLLEINPRLHPVASRRCCRRSQHSGAGLCRSHRSAATRRSASKGRRALVPGMEGSTRCAGRRHCTGELAALSRRLRGKIRFVLERSDAGVALGSLSPRRAVSPERSRRAAPRRRMGDAMRLAIISDVHANLEALQAVLADISGQTVDRIVCLGDTVGYNTKPAECLALLRRSNALCIAGNHDLAVCGKRTDDFSSTAKRAAEWTQAQLTADDLDYLRSLPLKAVIDGQLIAVHGALHPQTGCESVRLDNDERRMLSFQALVAHPSGARICAFGHTHRAGVYEWRDGRAALCSETGVALRGDAYYLINPGTVGEPRSRDRCATYVVLDLARRSATLRHVEYDASIPFIATRAAGLAPRFGLASLSSRLRSLIAS